MSARWMLVLVLVVVGCGGDEPATADRAPSRESPAAAAVSTVARASAGTRITLRASEFGTMLFGPNRQAIYIFERDRRNRTNCQGECAKAWPPVYTRGKPVAGRGVRKSLLGSIRRRDGRRQVTYAGKPLYYYAHEGPGQVLCHNVTLNGGLWWVIGPNGRRRH
jgi:predicted lipoprotein with Yx(FWY)xxD motif